MASSRGRLVLLLGLVVVLVVVVSAAWRNWRPTTAPDSASNGIRPARAADGGPAPEVDIVRLDALGAPRPDIGAVARNPFRFSEGRVTRLPPGPQPVPPEARGGNRPGPVTPSPGQARTGPIALKFIGIVEAPEQGGTVAVLSDGRSVFYGHEGDSIDGRFRIVSIGLESVVMSHLDGGGRQTIRLTGR